MSQHTYLLNRMDLLTDNVGHDDEGAILIAGPAWLADAFPPITVQVLTPNLMHLCRMIEFPAEPYYLALGLYDRWASALPDSFPASTYVLNAFRLVDMATDELARERMKIPSTDCDGKPLTENSYRNLFRRSIAEKVRAFLLDEMPEIMVNLLGQNVEDFVPEHLKKLQLLYQLMYLLTEHKAGIGDSYFMWHYHSEDCKPEDPLPDFTVSGDAIMFSLSPQKTLQLGSWVDGETDGIILHKAKKAPEVFPRMCYEVIKGKTEEEKQRFCIPMCWQYLHFTSSEPDKGDVLKDVVRAMLSSVYYGGNILNLAFIESVRQKGVTSRDWEGVYHP